MNSSRKEWRGIVLWQKTHYCFRRIKSAYCILETLSFVINYLSIRLCALPLPLSPSLPLPFNTHEVLVLWVVYSTLCFESISVLLFAFRKTYVPFITVNIFDFTRVFLDVYSSLAFKMFAVGTCFLNSFTVYTCDVGSVLL